MEVAPTLATLQKLAQKVVRTWRTGRPSEFPTWFSNSDAVATFKTPMPYSGHETRNCHNRATLYRQQTDAIRCVLLICSIVLVEANRGLTFTCCRARCGHDEHSGLMHEDRSVSCSDVQVHLTVVVRKYYDRSSPVLPQISWRPHLRRLRPRNPGHAGLADRFDSGLRLPGLHAWHPVSVRRGKHGTEK